MTEIQAILPTHEIVILTKFHKDRLKIVDFLLLAYFGADCVIFLWQTLGTHLAHRTQILNIFFFRSSLIGDFSPVRSAQPNIHVQITPAFTKTCDKTKVKSSIVQPRSRMQVAPPDKPMRFDVGQFKRPKTTTEHSSYSRSR